MTTTLLRTRSILHFDQPAIGGGYVTFARILDDPDETDRIVSIDQQAWEDMGSPNVVTVTIEPGDLLNDVTDVETVEEA